jgi:hypothetical protein
VPFLAELRTVLRRSKSVTSSPEKPKGRVDDVDGLRGLAR